MGPGAQGEADLGREREDTSLFEAEEKEEGNCEHIRCFDKQQKEVERMAPGQLGPAPEGKDLQGRACRGTESFHGKN